MIKRILFFFLSIYSLSFSVDEIDITSIKLERNTVFEDFQIETILRKYTGRNKNIYELMNVLENKYIERGYITTKVGLNIEKSDFENGKISLFVSEGKIDKILRLFNTKEYFNKEGN